MSNAGRLLVAEAMNGKSLTIEMFDFDKQSLLGTYERLLSFCFRLSKV